MAGKIFEYAILYHPRSRKVEGETQVDPSEIIVDVKRVVAKDEKTVAILAAREIPEEYLNGKLEQVEIAIRPF